jgi:hypothetical protein
MHDMLIYETFRNLVSYTEILNLNTLSADRTRIVEALFIHDPHDFIPGAYKVNTSLSTPSKHTIQGEQEYSSTHS